MFADDVVLIAEDFDKMKELFQYFFTFCVENDLKINQAKTKLMAVADQKGEFKAGSCVQLGQCNFECVESFVYLGVNFDNRASTRGMVSRVITKARNAMYWLLRTVQTQRWNHPNMRLVLMDIYVRSVLQFACSVWYPSVSK